MQDSVPTDSATERFPRLFGTYTLLHRLASGGMGSVYLARRDMSGMGGIEKHCILKTLKPSFTEDPEYIARFIDEARVVVQLSHRNICQVFDVGKVGTRHYLAMEYVPGVDLKTLLDRLNASQRLLPEAIALHMAIEALDALDYAHRHEDPVTGQRLRLVHRDVSPQNVMVNFEGEVKLIDFGLAASQLKGEQTQPNMVMGKLAYMAPEHARGDAVDPRSDLFALAVVLYELLVGERFYGELPMSSIWGIAGAGGYVPNGFSRIEPRLQQILARALAPDLNKRTATCGAMREELEEYVYANGLRGGKEKLRALMTELFTDDRESSRRLLSSFGTDNATAPKEPTEPTVTIAVAPAQHAARRLDEAAFEATVVAPREAMPPPRRIPMAASVAAVVVLAAAVAAVVLGSQTDPEPARVAMLPQPPVVVVSAPSPIAPDAGPDKPPGAVTAPPPAPPAAPVEPVAAAAAPVARPRPRKSVPRPGVDSTDGEKLKYLRAECPKQACVATVAALDAKRRAQLSKENIAAFKSALKSCVNTCGR